MGKLQAYVGRTFKASYTGGKINKVTLCDPVYIDYSKKQHTFIVSKSGGGKSYLAGVVAEELIRVMDNYCTILVDPMGIFSTLNMPNNSKAELDSWNEQLRDDVAPGAVRKCTIYVPAGDVGNFLPGTYDKVFALRAPEFSFGTLCYAFDLDTLEPQVNLYRKCQALLLREQGTYTLDELVTFVRMHGSMLHFQVQTVEALVTKLEALAELGIIDNDAPEIHEMIRDKEVVVFDLSLSSGYVAKILVSFLAEKIFLLRRKITRMVTRAKVAENKIPWPAWYIPPIQLVIDEAHEYLPNNPSLRTVIKKGRNCGMMVTAISQSPDLTRDVYQNITHLFVGPMLYEDDIAAVRSMLPIEQSLKDFKNEVHLLVPGTFLYYNVDTKASLTIKIRPRKTLHPATTELDDERRYFEKPGPLVLDQAFPMSSVPGEPSFTTILRHDGACQPNQVHPVVYKGQEVGTAKVVWAAKRLLASIPDAIVTRLTGTGDRAAAIVRINEKEPLKDGEQFTLCMLKWVERATAPEAKV